MLAERLLALTALAGRMVVVAAATDEWETARNGFAQLLGDGDVKQTRLTEAQLQATHEQLIDAVGADAGAIRTTLARRWAGRLADLLEENPKAEAGLQALVHEMQAEPRAEMPSASNHEVSASEVVSTNGAGQPAPEHPGTLAARSELAYSLGQGGTRPPHGTSSPPWYP